MMNNNFTARTSVVIHAPAAKVWDALTNPDMIRQYLFGTEVTTDWQVGSPIVYKGVWQDVAYEDRGKILEVETEKRLVSTYWSSMGGKSDVPENYSTVTYELTSEGDDTRLTVTQGNIGDEAAREHSEKNWTMVLKGLKNFWSNSRNRYERRAHEGSLCARWLCGQGCVWRVQSASSSFSQAATTCA